MLTEHAQMHGGKLTTRFNQQNEKSTSNYTTRVWVRGIVLV